MHNQNTKQKINYDTLVSRNCRLWQNFAHNKSRTEKDLREGVGS